MGQLLMEMENRRLWFHIAGPNYRVIPSEGREVTYLPAVHAMHGGFLPQVGYYTLVLLCRVNQVQLLCTQDFHILVRYNLEAEDPNDIQFAMPIQAPSLPILDPGIVHEVPMTHADRHGNSFTIPPAAMVGLFPLDHPVPGHVMVRFMGLPQPFRLRLENLRFTVGWAMLRRRVQFRRGDRLLLTRMGDGRITLGVRRAAAHPIDGLVHHARIGDAMGAHAHGDDFEVDEYPHPGRAQSVLPYI